MFNSPSLANHSYKLVFGILLLRESRCEGMPTESISQLGKRLEYLHKLLLDLQMKRLALINKDRDDFQYNSGDLVYIISPLTSQLRTASRKVSH